MSRAMKTAARLTFAALWFLFGGAFTLPIERRIGYTDTSGRSWREEGELRVSVVAARQMWELALRREGWRFVRTIPLDSVSHRHLEVWERGGTKLMLCLWSIAPGVSGYMWGTMEKEGQP